MKNTIKVIMAAGIVKNALNVLVVLIVPIVTIVLIVPAVIVV
jgi:hypothetical protein